MKIVLDDFGAGYSSISYLREMDFDVVKLDGSLIAASASRTGLALLQGVVALCRAMGQACVAEHIEETARQLELLQRLGCRYGQGFGLARPLSPADAVRLVASSAADRSHRLRPRRAAAG